MSAAKVSHGATEARREGCALSWSSEGPSLRFKGGNLGEERVVFGDVVSRRKSGARSTRELPSVEYEDVVSFEGRLCRDVKAKRDGRQGVRFSEGDVLFGKLRPYLGNWLLASFDGVAVGDWWVLEPLGLRGSYLYQLIQSKPFQLLANQSSGSKMPRADWNVVSNGQFRVVVDTKQQEAIGHFLASIDSLRATAQSALEKLEALKKSMLVNMFPQGDAKVPKIRFKGFEGEWKDIRLGDEGRTYNGLSGKTRADFGHGKGKYVTYMNVFGNPISKPEQCESVEIDTRQNEVRSGDVFFTTSSETPEEVGMSSVWLSSGKNTYLNSFCFGYRPHGYIDSKFLAYLLRSMSFREMVVKLAQGISRFNISKGKVMDIRLLMPEYKEQVKIGKYFNSLVQLIAARRDEIEQLKRMKAALLDRMFV